MRRGRESKFVRVLAAGAAVAAAALALPAAALAYGWPIKPFDVQHPVRAVFGDPRTIFRDDIAEGGLDGPGAFSFHNGIDIAAPTDTPVYPVESGVAYPINGEAIVVRTKHHRSFQYYHHRFARPWFGQRVRARRTVLGYVLKSAEHVHLSEIDRGRITNPLMRGHLRPFRDITKPVVEEIELRGGRGEEVSPLAVHGPVSIIADAYDTQPIPVEGPFLGFPFAPEEVTWSLKSVAGVSPLPPVVGIDFRRTLPPNRQFWRYYARGTYQNFPRIGDRRFDGMPGRYLFRLTRTQLDTRILFDGDYVLTVTAIDERGNSGRLSERIRICNFDPATCGA